jgi:hypothetical protein
MPSGVFVQSRGEPRRGRREDLTSLTESHGELYVAFCSFGRAVIGF